MHQLTAQDARRVAVRAQFLERERPADLLSAVRRLTFLQLDPTSAIAPSADLVAWSRLGPSYSPGDLRAAQDARDVVEFHAFVRPAEDIALYRARMAAWPGAGKLRDWHVSNQEWVRANERCRRDILRRLDKAGPLLSRELPDTCERPWRSTGWTNNQNITRLLGFMVSRGEVAIAGRKGRERLWDLAERVYPGHPAVPLEEAERERNRRRLRALGLARQRTTEFPMEPGDVGEAGEPAVVEGVRGEWRVDPAYLDGTPFRGRAALLSPFDRLVHDRARTQELFGFEYQLEMYKPAAKRQWGYFALPVLFADRLVGKLDAKADRKAGVLTVSAIHQDEPFTPEMTAAVDGEIADLAAWLNVEVRRAG
ncbi:MAG: DNA glycosylase AlkZ-like family protein [Trebonia sp.]